MNKADNLSENKIGRYSRLKTEKESPFIIYKRKRNLKITSQACHSLLFPEEDALKHVNNDIALASR